MLSVTCPGQLVIGRGRRDSGSSSDPSLGRGLRDPRFLPPACVGLRLLCLPPWTQQAGWFWVWGALAMGRCLVASLVSAHEMPVVSPVPFVSTKHVPRNDRMSPGGHSHPSEKHESNVMGAADILGCGESWCRGLLGTSAVGEKTCGQGLLAASCSR